MAQNISLPIYKTSYDLLLVLFILSAKFSREYKFTLGENLKKESIDLLINICRINNDENKKHDLFLFARDNVEKIRIYVRVAKDLKQINLDKLVDVNESLEYILKQLYLWEKNWARVA